MSLSYNKPTWTDNAGTAINASRLQAISNVLDGLINQIGTKSVVNIIINGMTMTMEYADGTIKQIENPTKGDKGDPGDDGYSPIVTITTIEGGHHVVITDADGDHEYDVMDGVKGDPGNDGISPTLTETPTENGYSITITDAEGTNTIELTNGVDGEDGEDGTSLTATHSKSGTTTTVQIKNAATGEVVDQFNIEDGEGSIPIASADTLGGIKVGENLTIEADGTLNAQGGGTDVGLSVVDGQICVTYES